MNTTMDTKSAASCFRKNVSLSKAILFAGTTAISVLSLHLIALLRRPMPLSASIFYTDASIPTAPPPLPSITLLTSAYKGSYSQARQLELSLVAGRNQRLSSISRYHRLFEHGMNFTPSPRVTGRVLSPHENVTYRALFTEAQHFDGIVVLANADIYFDESILCASMLSNRTVLALSRHPSPDCFTLSSRGDQRREPVDFCDGYHPKHQASHDVFVFKPPLPRSFLDALDNLIVNQFGAENVVIALLKAEDFRVVNPCSNIHAFHQHCTGERAATAKAGSSSIAEKRGEFSGTLRSGYVHGRQWMRPDYAARYGAVDCLGLGLMHGEELRST